jgi:hypothetical protein
MYFNVKNILKNNNNYTPILEKKKNLIEISTQKHI